MKILHILGRFDRGGVEVFLKDLFLTANSDKMDIRFLLLDSEEGIFDSELKNNGAQLNKIPLKQNFFKFCYSFYKLLKKDRIEVVHSHVQAFSGILLMIAFFSGVKVRVAHSHSEEHFLKKNISLARKIYLRITAVLLSIFANIKLACSEKAGTSLYGRQSFDIIVNGINTRKFEAFDKKRNQDYLNEFGLSKDDKIIGHVGRFDIPKNHKFIIEIAEQLVNKDSTYKFVLVGDGALYSEIKQLVAEKGLEKNVILPGSRDDIPFILTNLFDIFIFPSIYEGLPIVMLEAQIVGLYCVISNNISQESIVFSEQVQLLSLEDEKEMWVEKIQNSYNKSKKSGQYIELFKNSEYSILQTSKTFEKFYKNI